MLPLIPQALLPEGIASEDIVYLADRNLYITHVNQSWYEFAQDNLGQKIFDESWNSYLLNNMSGSAKIRWEHTYNLMLQGILDSYRETIICPSPTKERYYELYIEPCFKLGSEEYILHHLKSVAEKDAIGRKVDRSLKRLDDPDYLRAFYVTNILNKKFDFDCGDIAFNSSPLLDVGGDIVWNKAYSNGVKDLVLADAMGHGLNAATVVSKMLICMDSLTTKFSSADSFLHRLNSLLCDKIVNDKTLFVTGLLLRHYPDTNEMNCYSFGHDSPIFSEAGQIDLETGVPLGITRTPRGWPENKIYLKNSGRRILIFSDGITEQFNSKGEMFGVGRLYDSFRRNREFNLKKSLTHILDDLDVFRGGALIKDDRTIVGINLSCI